MPSAARPGCRHTVCLVAVVRLIPSLLAGTIFLIISSSAHTQEPNPAVEQSRLFPRTIPPTAGNLSPDGIALPEAASVTASDDSFGAQQILKTQEKIPEFTLGGGTSLFYTSNVALTHSDEHSDGFFVGDAALSWTRRLNPQLQFQLGG